MRTAVAIVFIFAAAIVAVVVALSMSKSVNRNTLGEDVLLPILLAPENAAESESVGVLRIQSAGEAEMRNFPVGSVKRIEDRKCLSWDGDTVFTGQANWLIDGNDMITITTEAGDSLIGPYHPTFSDVVWYRFGIPICGTNDVMWYRAEP